MVAQPYYQTSPSFIISSPILYFSRFGKISRLFFALSFSHSVDATRFESVFSTARRHFSHLDTSILRRNDPEKKKVRGKPPSAEITRHPLYSNFVFVNFAISNAIATAGNTAIVVALTFQPRLTMCLL